MKYFHYSHKIFLENDLNCIFHFSSNTVFLLASFLQHPITPYRYNIYTQSGYKNCGKSYIKAFQILKCLFEVCFGCGKQGLHNEELAHKQLFCALAHYMKKIHRDPNE